MKTGGWVLLAFLALSSVDALAEDEQISVKFGGFVDTYYAYDFNNPQLHDRSFTTQPARHNEFIEGSRHARLD